jgi:hypothetical protein
VGVATKLPGVPTESPGGLGPRQRYMPDMTDWETSPSQPGHFQFRSYCAGENPICNATRLVPQDFLPGCCDSEGTTEWHGWLAPCMNLNADLCQHTWYAKGSLLEEVANWFVERLGQGARSEPTVPAAPSDISVAVVSDGTGIGVS